MTQRDIVERLEADERYGDLDLYHEAADEIRALRAAWDRLDLPRVDANLYVALAWLEAGEPGKAKTAIGAALTLVRRAHLPPSETNPAEPHALTDGRTHG